MATTLNTVISVIFDIGIISGRRVVGEVQFGSHFKNLSPGSTTMIIVPIAEFGSIILGLLTQFCPRQIPPFGSKNKGYPDSLKRTKEPMLNPADIQSAGWFNLDKNPTPLLKDRVINWLHQVEREAEENGEQVFELLPGGFPYPHESHYLSQNYYRSGTKPNHSRGRLCYIFSIA